METTETFDRISTEQYIQFMNDYSAGKYPHLRFGQAFLNTYFPRVIHPKLFYKENLGDACDIIWDMYVNFLQDTPVSKDPEGVFSA